MLRSASFLVAATAVSLAAASLMAQAPADPGVGALKEQWRGVTAYITMAAEELSEADYAFRPVSTVRTFGELVGHVAGSQFMICAAALGEPQPAEDAVERAAKTKAALVKALKESTTYCERAYAQSGASATAATQLFGSPSTRMGALALNAVHNGEHYGNIITYMRIKGMVPPSSRQR